MSTLSTESESEDEQQGSNSSGFICLTELVRERYMNYLERQLQENVNAWRQHETTNVGHDPLSASIKQCVLELEQRAVNACIKAQLYQRNMVKIIATVRRDTQECRLEHTLNQCMNEKLKSSASTSAKTKKTNQPCFAEIATQTDDDIKCHQENETFSCTTLRLSQKKIDLFQVQPDIGQVQLSPPCTTFSNLNPKVNTKAGSTHVQKKATCLTETIKDKVQHATLLEQLAPVTPLQMVQKEDEDDIARELDVLFGEDKTELDDIFGINTQTTSDDPQFNLILQEIELKTQSAMATTPPKADAVAVDSKLQDTRVQPDLSRSLWPCELYMRRRLLSVALNRLIEDDLRWHELIKWRFSLLFGDDSDDEFSSCSPTIDLDEVLISSCIRRISPWVVKELMKPLNDGVIGNRFLFKKLAKTLAYWIIMDNQYPDKRFIKQAVECFFCWKHAVHSIDDLNDLSSISFKNL